MFDKKKCNSSYGPASFGYIPKITENKDSNMGIHACIPMYMAVLFTVAKRQKPSKCPSTDEWRSKLWYIPTVECYSIVLFLPEEGSSDTCYNTYEPENMSSEISKTQKDKCQISFI